MSYVSTSIQYGATVALIVKKDYDLVMTDYPTWKWLFLLEKGFKTGESVHTTALKIVNKIQTQAETDEH